MRTDTLHRSKTITVTVQNLLDDPSQLLDFLAEHHCIALVVDKAGQPFAKIVPYNDAILESAQGRPGDSSPGSTRNRRKEAKVR